MLFSKCTQDYYGIPYAVYEMQKQPFNDNEYIPLLQRINNI